VASQWASAPLKITKKKDSSVSLTPWFTGTKGVLRNVRSLLAAAPGASNQRTENVNGA
jgi:hypothetical protein